MTKSDMCVQVAPTYLFKVKKVKLSMVQRPLVWRWSLIQVSQLKLLVCRVVLV